MSNNKEVHPDVLVLFTKAPVLGQVKTRLAKAIGDHAALDAHITLVEDSLTRLSGHFANIQLCVSDDSSDDSSAESKKQEGAAICNEIARGWASAANLALVAQRGEGLGERMYNAFNGLFSQGAQRVVLVGTDCPGIDANYVSEAFAHLSDSDVVLGPAEDGGYGLIGLQAAALNLAAPLFGDLPWGTSLVLARTRALMEEATLDWVELETIWDVDELSDWQRYQALDR